MTMRLKQILRSSRISDNSNVRRPTSFLPVEAAGINDFLGRNEISSEKIGRGISWQLITVRQFKVL